MKTKDQKKIQFNLDLNKKNIELCKMLELSSLSNDMKNKIC